MYNADGVKRQAMYTIAGTTKKMDYCGNMVYTDGVMTQVVNEQGYATFSGTNPIYHYYLKDHLGNNRVVVSSSGATEQTTHYYAFGGIFGDAGTNADLQRYKYNGKELDRMSAIDLYDYGARNYDPALAIWTTQDPMAEERFSVSPYSYTQNNPINRIDRTGMLDDWVKDKDKNIYWDPKAVSPETTKAGETYLGKAVVVFGGFLDEKLGKNDNLFGEGAKLANVMVYGPRGEKDIKEYKGFTMSSDSDLFGVVADGMYNVNRIGKSDKKGPYQSEWTLNRRGRVPALNSYNPAHPQRTPGYLDGVFIHRSNNNGFAGKFWNRNKYSGVSEGCLLIAPNQWDTFNRNYSEVNSFKLIINRK